uniref:Uncharacterized protein n=1 Tax=Theileria annulata TaxID=5874 RepID=A0A3B0N4K0_THEAN
MEEINEFFSKLKGSGECFLTFESTNDCRSVLERFHDKEFKLYQCEVEPENIIWENIGYESHVNRKVFGISMVTIAILMAYIVLFFVPYAFYTITSPMTHILEILVLGLFVEFGNILISLILRNLIDKAGIINREVVDSYLMFCKYFIRLINLFLNVGLSHFINYGGRSKALSFLEHNPYLESPSFKVGEEVSFGLSFSIYVVNVFVLIPNALFLLEHYIIPIVNSFLVLTLDFEPKSAARLMQYSTFSLFSYYSDDMSNLTCCLLLFFLIKDQKQGSLVFLSLLVSYILNYAKSQFILLRRSSRKLYSTWRLSYFTYIMWAFPTLLLAVCPRYWDWRGGEGTIISIFINAVLHIVLYTFIIHIVFSKTSTLDTEITLSEVLEDNFFNGFEMELDYKAHNPVYKFKKFASQYNFF